MASSAPVTDTRVLADPRGRVYSRTSAKAWRPGSFFPAVTRRTGCCRSLPRRQFLRVWQVPKAVPTAIEILTEHVQQAAGPKRALVTYGQLGRELEAQGSGYPPVSRAMGRLLVEVFPTEHAAGPRMLLAIIVRSGSRVPSAA
jgi:hypothetical protein